MSLLQVFHLIKLLQIQFSALAIAKNVMEILLANKRCGDFFVVCFVSFWFISFPQKLVNYENKILISHFLTAYKFSVIVFHSIYFPNIMRTKKKKNERKNDCNMPVYPLKSHLQTIWYTTKSHLNNKERKKGKIREKKWEIMK